MIFQTALDTNRKNKKDMAIQWFPGHMNKAKKAIAERIKSVDMVIEMLDARMPASSENPLLAQLSKRQA